tara:strand:- start:2465 stop:2989 length:525 start_codon:yes stop_codon:yes gene_type:complete
MNNSLTGKIETNLHSLKGKYIIKNKTPLIIVRLKTQILDNLMLPLIRNNWNHINNNFFLINQLKDKLDSYYLRYKLDDLLLYKDILEMVQIVINEHNQLFDLEKEKYSSNNTNSLIYKTKIIRLKAEYEIYNLVYGKPKKNEIYNNKKLEVIRKLLKLENITFDIIKKKLEEEI